MLKIIVFLPAFHLKGFFIMRSKKRDTSWAFLAMVAKRILKDEKNQFSRPVIRLSVAGVALGVVVMLLAVGITSGYKHEIQDKVSAMGNHVRISNYDQNYSFDQTPIDCQDPCLLALKKSPDIANMQGFVTKVGIVKSGDQVEGIVLKGVDANFDWAFFGKSMVEGDSLCLTDTMADNSVVISKRMADKLCVKTGDKLQLYFVQDPPRQRRFAVAGIYETGLPEYDSRFALVDMRQVQKLNGWDSSQVSGVEVRITDYSRLDETGDYIHRHIGYGMKAETVRQLYPEIFEWIALFDTNVAVLLIITMCVCMVTMMSVFFIVALEQTQTIGVLKSLGMKTRHIVRLFMLVAARILTGGLLVGDVIALGFGMLQRHFHLVKLDPATYYVSYVPVQFDVWTVAVLNIGVLLCCMAVLVVPAWAVARKTTPVKAVRFE